MTKSPETAAHIMTARDQDRVHLLLCDALFQFQTSRSTQCHFHLEQPIGSQMVYQEELSRILEQVTISGFHMCVAGQLRHPDTKLLMQKGTQVLTTSRILAARLNELRCQHDHEHSQVAGSCYHPQRGRMAVSQYSEMYTPQFARKVARSIQCSDHVMEVRAPRNPDCLEEAFVTRAAEGLLEPVPKRQRLDTKQPPNMAYLQQHWELRLQQALNRIVPHAPKVGKKQFDKDSEVIKILQPLFDQHQLWGVEICKGADRRRGPFSNLLKEQATLRLSCGVKRHEPGVFCDAQWEDWRSLKKKEIIRPCPPARMLVTLFANQMNHADNTDRAKSSAVHSKPETDSPEPEPKRIKLETADRILTPPEQVSSGNPVNPVPTPKPRCEPSDHGPRFRNLSSEQRQQLLRMHNNLGHPDATVLGNVLKDQGWPSEAIEGIRDLSCPTCFERQKPKLSRPSSLSEPKEFNEVVAIDAVQWTSDQGEVYQFYHMIDLGTNFHVAFPSRSRTSSDIIQLITRHWIQWAGPPKLLMSDSAGEFCSDEFGTFLKGYDICSRVIPAEAHWQLGKAERHGAVLQDMLSKYQANHVITNYQEFELGLIHCTAAKNSLARHRGFTPEILVLGKSRHVPASIVDDHGVASELHADEGEPKTTRSPSSNSI